MIDVAGIPSVSVALSQTGVSAKANELGMRPMQERAYQKRGEQYLLIKSPPASGKSRALMFIALDKLRKQGLKQVIIVVPERSIGSSFADEPLTRYGFWADWTVKPQWNLCNTPGPETAKAASTNVGAVKAFLVSDDGVMVCTHATFRFAFEELGVDAFNDRVIAVDEFHHVSVGEDNVLGSQVSQLIANGKAHLVAMTGSYFRGDAAPVLNPDDEAKFETVTYTYFEQLNGYEYLKTLNIGYFFYSGPYLNDLAKVLDNRLKTIVHIPNVNARESLKDKIKEAEGVMEILGTHVGVDPATGFQLIKTIDGRELRVADLVDDDENRRLKVVNSLKDPAQKNNRDNVDVIIALGMAKEGFDWIWCEHALTIGYRSSLTEIVQIIGRATRDAKGKTSARFTNLIAEPDAAEDAVVSAVNDTLKAIAASLLMEQVLAPRFNFTPKSPTSEPYEGFDYGVDGYDPKKTNVGYNAETGEVHIEINGLVLPETDEARRICKEDLTEVITAFVQDKVAIEKGLFDSETPAQELTETRMGKIVRDRYPELSEKDQEAIRQQAIAALSITQQAAKAAANPNAEVKGNTAFIDGVRQFAMDVRELSIDLIDSVNPFGSAYAILAKSMTEERLQQVAAAIARRNSKLSPEDAKDLALRAARFKKEHGRSPSITSPDAWEKRLAEGATAFIRFKREGRYD
jgi:hypothetical protein